MCVNAGAHTHTHTKALAKGGRKTEKRKVLSKLFYLCVVNPQGAVMHGQSSGCICGWPGFRVQLQTHTVGQIIKTAQGLPDTSPSRRARSNSHPLVVVASGLFTTSQLRTWLLCFLEVLVVASAFNGGVHPQLHH